MEKKIKLSGFNQLTYEDNQALSLLYQPLIGTQAMQCYLLLLALQEEVIITYDFLSMLLDKSYVEVERLRKLLEQYQLVKTYEDENQMHYIDIQKPLLGVNFISNPLYARLLFSKLDEKIFKKIQLLFKPHNPLKEKREISEILDLGDKIEQLQKEEDQFQNVVEFGIEHDFDYTTFIQLCEPFMIPKTFVENKHILHRIGEYASIYHISAKNMAKFVAKSTLLASETLDFKKLVSLISKAKIIENDSNEVIHPLQLIQQKQNGVPPLKQDRLLVEKLFTVYRLDRAKINLLITHSLNKNDQRIQGNYIEKIAASWMMKNIRTLEEAEKTLQPKQKNVKFDRKEAMIKGWESDKDVPDEEIDVAALMK